MNIRARRTAVAIAGLAIAAWFGTTAAAAAPAASKGTKIGLRSSPNGKVLDGMSRQYVYVHVNSSGADVGCTGACQSIWPPVTTHGKPRAGHGVKASKLGQTASHQVTYHGHVLWYYAPSPQDPSIDGASSFNGTWLLINAKGKTK
jgi:predicted lipoprotein with Yx(FWY)xxD motif